MTTIAQILSMFATFLFGFLASFSGDFILQAYSCIAFVGMGALTVALMFVED
jgi:hypothetical protein